MLWINIQMILCFSPKIKIFFFTLFFLPNICSIYLISICQKCVEFLVLGFTIYWKSYIAEIHIILNFKKIFCCFGSKKINKLWSVVFSISFLRFYIGIHTLPTFNNFVVPNLNTSLTLFLQFLSFFLLPKRRIHKDA